MSEVTYVCYTCGELIQTDAGAADLASTLFVNEAGETVGVAPDPLTPDTTTHHLRHLLEDI